jgi:hypothetical protein
MMRMLVGESSLQGYHAGARPLRQRRRKTCSKGQKSGDGQDRDVAGAQVPRSNGGHQRFGVFTAAAAVSRTPGDILDFVERHALLGKRFEGFLSESVTDANEHGPKHTAMRIIVNTFCEIPDPGSLDLNPTRRRR